MARLEKSDFKVEHNPVAVNGLINAVVDSMGLQLKKKEADVTLRLDASSDIITGDELHLSNVIYTLVDNAVKYSPGKPRITISTLNEEGTMRLTVYDEGISLRIGRAS